MITHRFTRNVLPIIEEQLAEESDFQQQRVTRVQIPEKMQFLFQPARYKVAYGGRGGIKSWSFARALLIKGAHSCLRVLCAREFQNSIKESVHQLLCDQIKLINLQDYYPNPSNNEIKGVTGTEFIFAGLKQNVTKIKSTEGIDICWVEEAEKVSENSWQVLIPTIRKEGSEIWISFNPHEERDPTYKRFIVNRDEILREFSDSVIMETSWRDNPWLPKELETEKNYLARVDKDAYDHVWDGQVQKRSSAQVMRGKCVLDSFVPGQDWNGPYYGIDWGFSTDPVTLIKMWIYDNRLYIEEEFWGLEVELDDLPKKFDTISGAKEHTARADNSRPETIRHLQRHGYPRIEATSKWPGSVEDGISFLRAFEKIVIHPRCVHTDEESRTYKHKVDSLTGDVLPDIVDKNNNCWDAIRYGLDPLISEHASPGLFFAGASTSPKAQEHKEEKAGAPVLAYQDHALKGSRDRDREMNRWLRGE